MGAWTQDAFALGMRIADQGAAATARGNAFTATADDPSAIYYNPAGITQMDGFNASLGGYGLLMGSHYTHNGLSYDSKSEFQTVPQLFITSKVPDLPLTFGLGFYSPYGLALEWPEGTPFSTLAKRGQVEYLTANPVAAWQIIPGLSIGAGPTVNYSQADLQMEPTGPGSRFRFRGRGQDIGCTAGVLWQPLAEHSFGVNYRSATDINYRGHADTSIPLMGVYQPGVDASAAIAFPQNISFGYSFRPTPKWNFEFDADWTDWNRLNTVTLRPMNMALPFNWNSSWFYEFGATRYLEDGWSVSGGYIFSENSVSDRSFNPMVPDSDRHIFSLGIGKNYKTISWHAAYQFAWGPSRTLDMPAGAPNASANGTYEYFSHAITLSIGYHF